MRADGLIYDGETPIPGLTVAPDGAMTLTVNGKEITLDPIKAVFDDEEGFSYPGYEWDATANDGAGAWWRQYRKPCNKPINWIQTYGLEEQVANEEIIVVEEGGAVNVVKKGVERSRTGY